MNYVSTRGGEVVSGLEAVWRGISKSGGLYVPETLPQALPYECLTGQTLEALMADFFHRFIPEITKEGWEGVVSQALADLQGDQEPFTLPLAQVNAYLDRYYLLTADGFPTGSMSDLSLAILRSLLRQTGDRGERRGQPLVLALISEDYAAACLGRSSRFPCLTMIPQNGVRGQEIAGLAAAQDQLMVFPESFDSRYREFSDLAADPSFEAQLVARGYDPVFVGPGHIIEVLTAGALATAVIASIAQMTGGIKGVDFAVHKDHLSFLAGLVYASSLQIPVGVVYVGENEPAALASFFKTGRTTSPRKNRRRDDAGVAWPVNLERLLFEVTGRDEVRLKEILDQADLPDQDLLTADEINLLNQSVLVAGNDYKRCLRTIKNFYDQTDYLLARETADAVASWARYSKQKDEIPVCFVQNRSPLTDYVSCSRALFGDKTRRQDRETAIRTLSEEVGIPVWQTFGDQAPPPLSLLEGPMEGAILNWLDKKEEGSYGQED